MQEYERKYTRLTKCTDEKRSRLDPVKGMKVPTSQEMKNDVNGLEKLLRKEIVANSEPKRSVRRSRTAAMRSRAAIL